MDSGTQPTPGHIQHPLPINKGFLQLAEAFNRNGWKLVENYNTGVTYVNPLKFYDEFKIIASETAIEVVIPMPNSNVAYRTKFKNYFDASEYVVARLDDYMASSELAPQKHC